MTFNTENSQEVLIEPTTTKHVLLYYDGPMITIEQNGESLWYQCVLNDEPYQCARVKINCEMEKELVKRYSAEDDSAKWETIEELVFPLNTPIIVINILYDGSEHAYLVESYSKIKESYDNW